MRGGLLWTRVNDEFNHNEEGSTVKSCCVQFLRTGHRTKKHTVKHAMI